MNKDLVYIYIHTQWKIVVVQSLSCVRLFETPWTVVYQTPLSFNTSRSLLKFMSFESVTLSNNLIFCCLLLLPLVFPSIRGFSKELALPIRWPKFWGISFSNSLSNEYSGLIFFCTYSQTSCSVMSSGPYEALQQTKLVEVMEFQLS